MKIELKVENKTIRNTEEIQITGLLNDNRKFVMTLVKGELLEKNQIKLNKGMSSTLPDSFEEIKAYNKLLEMAIEKVNELAKNYEIVE